MIGKTTTFQSLGKAMLLLIAPLISPAQSLIPLSDTMFYNLSIYTEPGALVDEQQLMGDPLSGGQAVQSFFDYTSSSLSNNSQFVLDLGAYYDLHSIWFYDINASDTIFVSSGDLINWSTEQAFVTDQYFQWHALSLNTRTRFVRLRFRTMGAKVGEMALYGTFHSSIAKSIPTPISMPVRPMREIIGTNGFVWSPDTLLQAIGSLREYRSWDWSDGGGSNSYSGYPQNEFAFSPAYNFDTDDFYQRMQQQGIEAHPCLQLNPFYLRFGRDPNAKPIAPGADSYHPASYIAHADYLFQFAARYGSQAVSPQLLKLRNDQQPLSGLNLIRYIENWNEPDKWWLGKESHFNPFEMAAMCSADYDGHEGSLGSTVGVKQADPSMKLVLGGLTQIDLHYIRGMKAWSDMHRSSFPVDVINFHHYSNDAGGQGINPSNQGISPEQDSLKWRLRRVVEYRDRYLPGVEIWLSEFGYSTHPNSPQRAPAIGAHDTYEMQGRWLVRSFLEIAASGIDRAHQFALDDPNSASSGTFSTAGLTKDPFSSGEPPYERKPSWFYLSGMKNLMADYAFNQEIPSGQTDVNIYEFHHLQDQSSMLVVWCNTSNDTRYTQWPLALPQSDSLVQLYHLQADSAYARPHFLHSDHDSIRIDLSEMPVFIRLGADPDSVILQPDTVFPVLANQSVNLYLNEEGSASLTASDLGLSNIVVDTNYQLWIAQSGFDCQDEGGPFSMDIYSGPHWTRSWYQENSQGFPWIGVQQLPAASTFNQAVSIGQPYTWNSLDVVAGSQPIKCGSHVTFYRTTFQLGNPQGKTLTFLATVDDDMEIFLNGHRLAREGSYSGSNSKFPAHRLSINGSAHSGGNGFDAFDWVEQHAADELLLAGENELIVAVRNGGNGNLGGFSFHLSITGMDALPVQFALSHASGWSDTAMAMVSLLDTLPFTVLARDLHLSLPSSGYALVAVDSIDAGSFDNCAPIIYRSLSIDTLDCSAFVSAESATDSLVIISDQNWTRSYVTQSYSYPFDQMNINLPALSTYNQPVVLGQPYHWHRVDQILGTEMIKTNPGISFYRKTFSLANPSSTQALFEFTLDDYLKVYLNGVEVLGTDEPDNWSGGHQFPSYRIEYSGSSSPLNGPEGPSARAVGRIYANDIQTILQAGENEIILVAGNKNDANNFGGISFRMILTGGFTNPSSMNTSTEIEVPVVLTVANSAGDTLQANASVWLSDPSAYCSSAKQESSYSAIKEAWQAQLYPNPTLGEVVYFGCASIAKGGGWLRITDLRGGLVAQSALQAKDSYQEIAIACESWPKGVYVLTYHDAERTESFRLLVR